MARTLSITDDDTGITARMRIEESDGEAKITSLHFDAADGYRITAGDLEMVRQFGLQLPSAPQPPQIPSPRQSAPANPPPPSPEPRKAAPPAAVRRQPPNAAKKAAPGAPRRKRYDGGVPDDATLQALYAKHGGMPSRMSNEVGASASAVSNWLRTARMRGVVFALQPRTTDVQFLGSDVAAGPVSS